MGRPASPGRPAGKVSGLNTFAPSSRIPSRNPLDQINGPAQKAVRSRGASVQPRQRRRRVPTALSRSDEHLQAAHGPGRSTCLTAHLAEARGFEAGATTRAIPVFPPFPENDRARRPVGVSGQLDASATTRTDCGAGRRPGANPFGRVFSHRRTSSNLTITASSTGPVPHAAAGVELDFGVGSRKAVFARGGSRGGILRIRLKPTTPTTTARPGFSGFSQGSIQKLPGHQGGGHLFDTRGRTPRRDRAFIQDDPLELNLASPTVDHHRWIDAQSSTCSR